MSALDVLRFCAGAIAASESNAVNPIIFASRLMTFLAPDFLFSRDLEMGSGEAPAYPWPSVPR
jgi:hypothetical protein